MQTQVETWRDGAHDKFPHGLVFNAIIVFTLLWLTVLCDQVRHVSVVKINMDQLGRGNSPQGGTDSV